MSRKPISFADFGSDSDDESPNPAAGAAAAPRTPPPVATTFVPRAISTLTLDADTYRPPPVRPLEQFRGQWIVWDAIEARDFPCPCCCDRVALEEPDFWTCQTTGRRWFIVGQPPSADTPHPPEICPGDCPQHPPNKMYNESMLRWMRGSFGGVCWADLWQEEEDQRFAMLPVPQQIAELKAKDLASNRMARQITVGSQISHIQRVQEGQAARYAARGKIPQPCKKLYDCQRVGGRDAVPTKDNVCTECWRYEYTHPDTGERVVVRTCNWLHPGEAGWQTEWDTNRHFKPAVPIQVEGGAVPERRGPDADGWERAGAAAGGGGGGRRHGGGPRGGGRPQTGGAAGGGGRRPPASAGRSSGW